MIPQMMQVNEAGCNEIVFIPATDRLVTSKSTSGLTMGGCF